MANSNVNITPGTGVEIAADLVGAVEFQCVKIDLGGAGQTTPASAGAHGGLNVEIPAGATVPVTPGGGAFPVSDNGASLTVDAPSNAPVAVRLSDGTNPIATLPVQGTVAAQQSGTWATKITDGANNVGVTGGALNVAVVSGGQASQTDRSAFTEGTSPCQVAGGVYDDGAVTSPSLGQAAAARITQQRAVHVNVRKSDGTELGTSANPVRVDPSGTTTQPVSGTVNAALNAGTNAGAAAKTVNLNTGGGTDTVTLFGIALPGNAGAVPGGSPTNPIRTDPTGTTTQPVSGTVTANQGGGPWSENLAQVGGAAVATAAVGVQKVGISDATGAAFGPANPVPVQAAPRSGKWRAHVLLAVNASNVAIHTPPGGKTVYVQGWILTINTSDVFVLSDNAQSDSTDLYKGQPGAYTITQNYTEPEPLAAVNNVLRYSTGASIAGDLTVWGFDA